VGFFGRKVGVHFSQNKRLVEHALLQVLHTRFIMLLHNKDDRLIIKEVSRSEMDAFLKFAPHYFAYMSKAMFHRVNQTSVLVCHGVHIWPLVANGLVQNIWNISGACEESSHWKVTWYRCDCDGKSILSTASHQSNLCARFVSLVSTQPPSFL
jgi:hypothetical protein